MRFETVLAPAGPIGAPRTPSNEGDLRVSMSSPKVASRGDHYRCLDISLAVWSPHLPPDELQKRLATAEVVSATVLPRPRVGVYESGALVPSTAWRRLTDKEFNALSNGRSHEAPSHASLVLLAPSSSFIAELAAIAAEQAALTGRDSLHVARADLRAQLEELLDRDRTFLRLGPALSACISISDGGLNTLTPNQDRTLAGLHVDSWDGLVLTERRQGSNRLVVNIGASPRYLIFAPFEVASIAQAMGWRSEAGLDVARAFLLQRDRRVYRLEIRPGEAYLAPTENLIHDASSLGAEGPDRALMLRAHLQLTNRRQAVKHVTENGSADFYLTKAVRHQALKDAISILGGPSVADIIDHKRGASSEIYRLQTTENEIFALRIGTRISMHDADAWQVKSVLCAQAVQFHLASGGLTRDFSELTHAPPVPVKFLDAPVIHAFQHGCKSAGLPPWELCTWASGTLLGETTERRHFSDLGRSIAAIHDVRFSSFLTGLGPNGRKRDGASWLLEQLRALVTPALERRIGKLNATTLRRGNYDATTLRWSLLHGDLHAANAIVGNDRIWIIDWDDASVGPPEFDFAPLKHVTHWKHDRGWVKDGELYAATLAGYRASGGVADETMLAMGELFYLLKCFHLNHIENRRAGNEEIIESIVDLTARIFA